MPVRSNISSPDHATLEQTAIISMYGTPPLMHLPNQHFVSGLSNGGVHGISSYMLPATNAMTRSPFCMSASGTQYKGAKTEQKNAGIVYDLLHTEVRKTILSACYGNNMPSFVEIFSGSACFVLQLPFQNFDLKPQFSFPPQNLGHRLKPDFEDRRNYSHPRL